MSTERKEGGEGAGEEEGEVASLSKNEEGRSRKAAVQLSHLAILSTCSSGVECVRWS
jgi:hypothetical protein